MKNFLIRGSSFLLAVILMFNGLIFMCSAESSNNRSKPIRVGWYDSQPGSDTSTPSLKYSYEYLQALSQYTNWSYEYVEASRENCLKMLADGEIDLLGFVNKSAETEALYGFPEQAMAITGGLLVTNAGSEIHYADREALNGISVGLVTGNEYNPDFVSYCETNNINVTFVEYASVQDITAALLSGEVGAAVLAEQDSSSSEQIIMKFASHSQYFATRANNKQLLDELNSAMIEVNTYCPYLNSDLFQKYFRVNSDGKPLFTAEEKEFIKNNPNILVMYDSGWPPVEYFDEKEGVYKGISPDIFALLSQKCEINFVYEGSTSGQVLNELENGDQRNVLTTISYDYEWAEKHDVYITQPFISSDIVKLGRNLNCAAPVVAINENAYFTYALQDKLQNVQTIHYKKQAERLEAVRTGEADYTYVTEDQANYYRSIPKYSNLQTEKMVGYEQQVCISIKKDSDPELMSIISKSIASITHDEMTAIIIKNTASPYKLTLADELYKNRVAIIAVIAFAVALFILIITKLKSDKLKRLASEQANRAKSEFLSHVSHDIRTPLNAIIGITSLAIEEEDPDIEKDYLAKISESGQYLLGLINDTLDMSKIESGKMSLHYEPVNFKEIHDVIMAVIMPKAKEKNITVTCDNQNIDNTYVMLDKLRFEQIILNLFNNAVKFTPDGGHISCNTSATIVDGESIRHRVSLRDNGVGMSEDFMKKLFQPFEQERNKLSVENNGTGLGLSIVKSLVDMMGGTITCTSKKDVGTEFVFEVTSKIATEEEISKKHTQVISQGDSLFIGKHVLIAEDNSLNILVANKLLEKKAMISINAKNGEEAINIFSASQPGFFDAILMDIHMPKVDGLVATKTIRNLDRPDAKTIPIIALSANAYDEDRRECIDAGMNDHVAKPIVLNELYLALRKAFDK